MRSDVARARRLGKARGGCLYAPMRVFFLTATRIGDAVLSTGLLNAILQRFPGARITIAVGRPAAPLFARVPGLERLIVVDKLPRGGHWWQLWRQVGLRHWGIAVDLRASMLTRFMVARRRILAPLRAREREHVHRVAELARIARLPLPPAPTVWLSPAERAAATALLPPGDFLALAPTANWIGKQWPAERFAELALRLTAPGGPLAGLPVAVFGAESERAMAAPLLAASLPGGLVDLIGRTDLLTAAACLERARLFVGNDSGLMHLAAAAGAPTLGLFGPTADTRYGPWGPRAAVVRTPESLLELRTRPGFASNAKVCYMTSLTVAAVEAAARKLLAET